MILTMILSAIFGLINVSVALIPDSIILNDTFDISSLASLISKAFFIFPIDLFRTCLVNITFWLSVQMLWAIIEWVYKKVPGVN